MPSTDFPVHGQLDKNTVSHIGIMVLLTNLTQYEISFHLIFLHDFESLSS